MRFARGHAQKIRK